MQRLIALVIGLGLVAAACSDTATTTSASLIGSTSVPPATFVAKALQPFDACEDLLSWIKGEALERVSPYGLEGTEGPWFGERFAVEESIGDGDVATAPSAGRAGDDGAGVDYSTTNVQEVGIDEPDLVKTDGDRIIAVANGRMYYIDVSRGDPVLVDSVRLGDGWAHELFLSGDRALVMSLSNQFGPGPVPLAEFDYVPYGNEVSVLMEVDLSDPSDLEVTRTLFVDGTYLSARMEGDTARVVLRSRPTGLVFTYPESNGLRALQKAEDANRRIIEESTIDNWLPYYVLQDGSGDTIEEGVLLDCTQMSHPEEFAGFNTLSILTIDVADGIGSPAAVGIFADGDTVYASPEAMYVATQRWFDWSTVEDDEVPLVTTEIHKFATDGAATIYVASGSVTGFLLNQWAMSEHEGNLRVASTTQPPWRGGDTSESMLTVLEEDAGELRAIGRVDGLGKGERIYAVRYFGEVAYIVTFRQTDPLYTVDLSDPTSPTVRGELKILGYSAYLHPLGDDLLVGIGQDATEEGRVLGTQISVFDVSDLDNPTRLHRHTISDAHSELEWDHRAFLYWPETGLMVVPINKWSWDERSEIESYFSGAVGFTVDRENGISEVGRVDHTQRDGEEFWAPGIRRSLVVGDLLYTVSDSGIEASDLDTLDETAWIGFTL